MSDESEKPFDPKTYGPYDTNVVSERATAYAVATAERFLALIQGMADSYRPEGGKKKK